MAKKKAGKTTKKKVAKKTGGNHRATKKATPKVAHVFTMHPPEVLAEFGRVLKKCRNRLWRLPGVDYVSGGYQYKKGVCTGRLAIRLETSSVEQKKLLRRFINELGVQKRYGDRKKFPVDIVVRNFRLAQLPGDLISTSHLAGTLGGVVTLRGIGKVWLTAAHVVSSSSVLPSPLPSANVPVTEAGAAIGFVPGNNAGFFQCDATVDCALIKPSTPLSGPSSPLNMNSGNLAPGMAVKMVGGESGLSKGSIESVDDATTPPRQIQDEDGNVISVSDQFYVTGASGAFAQLGDSGALVLLDDGTETVVGILRAADVSGTNGVTVISKIDNAAAALRFS